MAKGNDGNYLQHSIEIESATRLAGTVPRGRLHIALTHGMAPWEPFREPIHGQVRRLLDAALTEANNGRKSDEPPIVTAYRKTRASKRRYPNSAELLRTVVGTNKLSGGITEVCDAKYKALADAWCGSRVVPVHSSWRYELGPGGQLAVPNDLRSPWLFSMDPMTYTENGDKAVDDDYLRRADLDRLTGALTLFVESDMGAALFRRRFPERVHGSASGTVRAT